MAEAMVDTIPCECCNTQINLQDWVEHIRICSSKGSNRTQREERTTPDNQSDNERIPCEYCNALISVDDWRPHSNECSDTHNNRIKYLRNIDNKPIDTSIPCEYCDTQVSVHDWEWHTRQCANDYKRHSKKSEKDEPALVPCEYCNTQVSIHELELHTRQCADGLRGHSTKSENDEPALIPCEYCNTPVSVHELEWHTNKCAQAEKKRIADLAKRIAIEPSKETIPCEYCNKSISVNKYEAHKNKCQRKQTASTFRRNAAQNQISTNNFPVLENLDSSASKNVTRFDLEPRTEEYQFVAENFHKTLPNEIVRIQQIQNRRWLRQYDAHKDDFIERYGNSTERWLFHGCRRAESADAIILDCFNRSHAVNCAVGQGIYFAAHAAISHGYTQPDAQRLRHMFMGENATFARVLVGRTTQGNSSTRVCPPGFDTTGTRDVFVTYHDAQAYAQYLIIYR